MKTTSERDSSFAGIHENVLHTSESLCERVVAVRVDQNVHVLDNTSKILVALLRIHVQLEKNTIELVAHDHGLDSLGKSLSENGFRLHGNTLDAIDDDQGSVGNSQSGSDLRREIDVTRRIDQIDQVRVLTDLDGVRAVIFLLGDIVQRFRHHTRCRVVLEEKRDTGRLDRDTSLLLVSSRIRESSVFCVCFIFVFVI